MKIGSRDTDRAIFIIAEIGNNHEGSYSLAVQMVHEAAEAGADAVKFQCIDPDHLADSPERLAQLKAICLPWPAFENLQVIAGSHGVEFLCTPFNVAAVELLDPLVPAWKIAARSYFDDDLRWAVSDTSHPILQSATEYRYQWAETSYAMHVVSEYPCPPEHANLTRVTEIGGYSDHTIGIDACVGAAFLGARVIEKHFHNRESKLLGNMKSNRYRSNDHVHSATAKQFKEMVKRIRKAEVLCSRPDSSSA